MATAKKLDIFILKDSFNLGNKEILKEAQASAKRRAEVMDWQDVKVKQGNLSVVDGDIKRYSFEIWGFGEISPGIAGIDSLDLEESKSVGSGVSAAKNPEL